MKNYACKIRIKIIAKKDVENSEIRPDSETLTSNTREPDDLSSNLLSFIQGLGAEAPVGGSVR